MAEATDYLTVYHYSGNNPVMFNDPMGNLRNTYGRQIYYSAVPPSGTSETNPEGWAAWDYQNGVIDTYRFGEIIEYYKEKRDREERTGEISLYDEKGGGLFDLAEFATFLSGGGSGEGGGRNIIISPEGKILSISKPDPLQKGDTFALSSDWDPKGGIAGTGTGTTSSISINEALALVSSQALTHEQELAIYGQIVAVFNGAGGAQIIGGAAVEYGVIVTDKGFNQEYSTTYPTVYGLGASVGINMGVIVGRENYKPTFSDWKGYAYNGVSGSYVFFNGSWGHTSAYNVYTFGYGLGLNYKDSKYNATFNPVSSTSLIGNPYQNPQRQIDFTGTYIHSYGQH